MAQLAWLSTDNIEDRDILPVTKNSDENLTNNNTDNLQVFNGVDPLRVANLVVLPTRLEGGLEEWLDVSDRKKHITNRRRHREVSI